MCSRFNSLMLKIFEPRLPFTLPPSSSSNLLDSVVEIVSIAFTSDSVIPSIYVQCSRPFKAKICTHPIFIHMYHHPAKKLNELFTFIFRSFTLFRFAFEMYECVKQNACTDSRASRLFRKQCLCVRWVLFYALCVGYIFSICDKKSISGVSENVGYSISQSGALANIPIWHNFLKLNNPFLVHTPWNF